MVKSLVHLAYPLPLIFQRKNQFSTIQNKDWVLIKSTRLDEWTLEMNGIQNVETEDRNHSVSMNLV